MFWSTIIGVSFCTADFAVKQTASARPIAPVRKVEVVRRDNAWILLRAGVPYTIKGVGGISRQTELVQAGGNSARTWGSENAATELDTCESNGLSMMLGIWLGHRSYFNYSDLAQVAKQKSMVEEVVRRHRNHPALLMYGLGNEMELDNNDNEATWRAIGELAKLCKQIDPNHPAATVVADVTQQKIDNIKRFAPDIDILGINSYGGMSSLAQRLKAYGWTKPYVVTEFGPRGPWELTKTEWKAAYEPTSTEKAASYKLGIDRAIVGNPAQCVGSYAFLWGSKQEETPTWFGMFLPSGERTEAIDVVTRYWSGKRSKNEAPRIQSFNATLKGKVLGPDSEFSAMLAASDPDGDPLTYVWSVLTESPDKRYAGENETAPAVVPGPWQTFKKATLTAKAPTLPGTYRLYVRVLDGKGNAGAANLPFRVK